MPIKFSSGSAVTVAPYAYVKRAVDSAAIANATDTAAIFDTEIADTDTMIDIAGNPTRITITTAGTYLVTTSITWASNATGQRNTYIRKNGTTVVAYSGAAPGATGTFPVELAQLIPFAAADYFEVMQRQTSGGTLVVSGSAGIHGCSCACLKVGP